MTLRHRPGVLAAAALLAVVPLAAGCGGDSGTTDQESGAVTIDPEQPVAISMHDIGFDKTTLTVTAGTEVVFEFTNTGKVPHDAFIGDHAAQLDHEAEMAAMGSMASMPGMTGMGDMGGHGAGEHAITVQPGQTGSLTYTFDEPGTYEIGCHQPGHYAAGMMITVIVT